MLFHGINDNTLIYHMCTVFARQDRKYSAHMINMEFSYDIIQMGQKTYWCIYKPDKKVSKYPTLVFGSRFKEYSRKKQD